MCCSINVLDGNDLMPALFNLDHQCFDSNEIRVDQQQQFFVNGTLKLVNTIEEFKNFHLQNALESESEIVRLTFIEDKSFLSFLFSYGKILLKAMH